MSVEGEVDVRANRASRKWTAREQCRRASWVLGQALFRLVPRPFWGVRRSILRLYGASVGAQAHVYPSARITNPWNLDLGDFCAVGDRAILYALGVIRIGNRTTISQGAHICAGTHDWRDPRMPLVKTPIVIGDDVWICAEAFIGPGVSVSSHAIVGARAVVTKTVAEGKMVAGNPAREIGERRGR